MENNPYLPPSAPVAEAVAEHSKFYVVSMTKYWLLMVFTFGLYRLYWFYKHWALYRVSTGQGMWPVMRALFPMFFANGLFREIDAEIVRNKLRYDWNWQVWAAVYVLAVIVEYVSGRFDRFTEGSPIMIVFLFLAGFAGTIASFVAGSKAQQAANVACGDPNGDGNSGFTAANWFWILLFPAVLVLGFLVALSSSVT